MTDVQIAVWFRREAGGDFAGTAGGQVGINNLLMVWAWGFPTRKINQSLQYCNA